MWLRGFEQDILEHEAQKPYQTPQAEKFKQLAHGVTMYNANYQRSKMLIYKIKFHLKHILR